MKDERSCATCRWRELEEVDVGYVCTNGQSSYCSEWVEEDDVCLKWEERKDEKHTVRP